MRQAVIARHGGPDVFELREAPDPPPGANEVRIAVKAAGVSFADVLARAGLYPDAPPLPFTPGYEVSGVVEDVGPGVTRLLPGSRVVALTRFGGYATRVVAPADHVFEAHAEVSDTELAALPVNYLTAMTALYRMANIQAGEHLLVIGAGGGVGLAATSLARLRRAQVIGTASAGKLDAIRQHGVDFPLDRRGDVRGEVMRITGGRGADVVLDPVGGASFTESYAMLAPLGRLVLLGVSTVMPGDRRRWWPVLRAMWQMPTFKPLSLINRNRGVFGLNLAHLWSERRQMAASMEFLLAELRSDRLRPVVARSFPLDRVSEAHRYVHARANVGKIVLTM